MGVQVLARVTGSISHTSGHDMHLRPGVYAQLTFGFAIVLVFLSLLSSFVGHT